MKLDYIGKELENFSVASFWRKYVMSHFKTYYKNKNVLEVGSGIGSFSELVINDIKELTLLEPDQNFCNFLNDKFKNQKKIKKIINGTTNDINDEKFDVIFHFQVLEHLKDDNEEILRNLDLLKTDGHLLICVPSFMSLYSKFDEAIGHHRRYVKNDFLKFNLNKSKIKKMFYIDSMGFIIYRLFSLFLNSSNPNKFLVYIWDKFFIPISYLLDKILLNKVGKNLIVIIKKS